MSDAEIELLARRVAELIRPEEPWLSKAEIARHFGCSTRSIELAMKDGLPYRPIFGRSKFRASEVQAWLDNGKERPCPRWRSGVVWCHRQAPPRPLDAARGHDREVSPDGQEA